MLLIIVYLKLRREEALIKMLERITSVLTKVSTQQTWQAQTRI